MDRNKLPHGTIICPNCGGSVSGCLDTPVCDECNKPFWPEGNDSKPVQYARGVLRPIWIIYRDNKMSIKDQADMIMNQYQKFKAKPKQILVHDTPRGMQLAMALTKRGLTVVREDLYLMAGEKRLMWVTVSSEELAAGDIF